MATKWLGHESIETTHIYVEADLAIKERALERIAPANSSVRRYKADDTLLAFLVSLSYAATIAVVGAVPIDRLWHAVPAYPTISEVWLRLLETLGL